MGRVAFSEEESAAIMAGVAKHGVGRWEAIRTDPEFASILVSRSGVNLKDRYRNMSRKSANPGWPLRLEMQQFSDGVRWCWWGVRLAWSNPTVRATQSRRLLPLLLLYFIVMVTALAAGLQLRLWLWLVGRAFSVETPWIDRSLLECWTLLTNSFCLMSIATLFVLRMALDGDPVFLAVLAPLSTTLATQLTAAPAASIMARTAIALRTTGVKLLALGLCHLAWHYPATGIVALPIVFFLKVGTPNSCVWTELCGKGGRMSKWLQNRTGHSIWVVRGYGVLLCWLAAWSVPAVRGVGPEMVWILQEGMSVSVQSRRVGCSLAVLTATLCILVPPTQEPVLVLLNMHAAAGMLSMELLYTFSVRAEYPRVKDVFKRYRWQLAGFGMPLLVLTMIPGGGVVIWTCASGAAAYLHYKIHQCEQAQERTVIRC
eukprot:TRINITY_DN24196_c0_g2_i1.p1 TRINITY_DN24196_c0_g2~~TRINITY_DN24196_c0_g2_i1.p1  ORF type:complete len:429 (+),score=57.14 TRINITY_DN24196_c0_g2_i1:37-1323(+)